jgi:ATP-dependent DNA helicase RecG
VGKGDDCVSSVEIPLPPKESLTVEFKSDRKRFSDDDLVQTVVGMANTEGGMPYT